MLPFRPLPVRLYLWLSLVVVSLCRCVPRTVAFRPVAVVRQDRDRDRDRLRRGRLLRRNAWYTDPTLSRSVSSDFTDEHEPARCFVVVQRIRGKAYHWYREETKGDNDNDNVEVAPLWFTWDEIQTLSNQRNESNRDNGSDNDSDNDEDNDNDNDPSDSLDLFWVGARAGVSYYVVYDATGETIDVPTGVTVTVTVTVTRAPLREFGDRLASLEDAAVLATANALVEFHHSHQFCSYCGSPTLPRTSRSGMADGAGAGASRVCSDSARAFQGQCRAPSLYPRIDLAAIMLVTSPCGQYALLGRKASWPSGRYSTLAGFVEVGETIEHCCVRETREESGIHVDPTSLQFVQTQPWPFPQSLMVGFRARALPSSSSLSSSTSLPEITFDKHEMQDVRWFHKRYVADRLQGGSTALSYVPNQDNRNGKDEREFHIPGKASLARVLITEWALEPESLSER